MNTKTLTSLSHGAPHHCFGCGETNRSGLRLKFFVDEQKQVLCHTRLAPRFAGPPGHAHGGIIATLLDEAMSKATRVHDVVAMTRLMEVEYLRPVPLGCELTLTGRRVSHHRRKNHCEAEIRDAAGVLFARGKSVFIAVDRSILLRSAKADTGKSLRNPARQKLLNCSVHRHFFS